MEILISIAVILVGFFVGGAREKKHFEDLKRREAALLAKVPTRNVAGPKLTSGTTFLVVGSVVVASDAFKDFVGGLKSFFGGRMGAQESLLDRARREAICRLRESALSQGAKEVVDVHIVTSFLDQMGAEVSAYGTAVRE
jgi:uncharacterized protein YbjQ (UPF0145 family)